MAKLLSPSKPRASGSTAILAIEAGVRTGVIASGAPDPSVSIGGGNQGGGGGEAASPAPKAAPAPAPAPPSPPAPMPMPMPMPTAAPPDVAPTPSGNVSGSELLVFDHSLDATSGGGFASQELLQSHFVKHGAEFDVQSASQYAQQANNFLLGPTGANVLETTRIGGDVIRYNPNTNEFGVVNIGGIIRTYFKPDSSLHNYPTNLDYFNEQ